MTPVLFGLVAAISWGVYDFLSRFPSRAVGPLPTIFLITFSGLILLTAWVLVESHEITVVWTKLWLVAVTGIFFALGNLALFAAFALGPMTIVAPIVATYPVVAMLLVVAQGARPTALQWLAIASVILGVLIASRSGSHSREAAELPRGEMKIVLGLSALAAISFAIAITAGQEAAPTFGEVETVWLARIFSLLTIGLVYLWRSPVPTLPWRWLPLLGLMGGLDVGALIVITAAGKLPSPEFATVVSSSVGAVTVILARIFLKEQISPAQLGGMAMIFGGITALAAL
jgi:uncharacterized membrane protein